VRVWREHNVRARGEGSGDSEWLGKKERDVYKKERNGGRYSVRVTL